jgi:hypothetical protein
MLIRFCSLLTLLLMAAIAQETRGTLTGSISDPSGASVPGAKVRAVNDQTNIANETLSTADGTYTIPFMLSGTYTVSVEVNGFRKTVRKGIEVRISDRVNVDFALQLGSAQESVTVAAEAPLLETSSATTGQVIDRKRIAELPLADGNPLALVRLAPGIVFTGDLTSASALSNSAPSNFESNGSPGGNEFTLDGSPNTADRNANGSTRVGLQPPTDAVEEFKVVTATFDAQQGRTAGGSVDVSIRSGSNQLHGTLYEFVRNDVLSANSFFLNRSPTELDENGKSKRQARRYNRFGGTVGGPLVLPKIYNGKDRTFFFVSWERIRTVQPAFETLTLPTAAFRAGDFSSLAGRNLLVYDPATARQDGARIVRTPIQCNGRVNVICPERISPIARNYLSFLPQPNTNLNSTTNNFFGNGPGDNSYYVFITRFDHQFNEKNKLLFRYSETNRVEQDENSLGIVNGVRANGRIGTRGNLSGVIDYIYLASPTTILNIRGGYTRFAQDRSSLSSLDYDVRQLGFSPQTAALFSGNTLPQFSISNYSSPSEIHGYFNASRTPSLQPTLTRIARSHTLRFGYDWRSYQQNRIPETFRSGSYSFGNDFTRINDQNPSLPIEQIQAQAMAAFLLGQPTGGNFPNLADHAATANYHGLFFQDDWKVTRRLTLNFGLRWELDQPTTERYNRLLQGIDTSVVNPLNDAVRTAYGRTPIPELSIDSFRLNGVPLFSSANSRGSFRADRNNFQPRVGFALALGDKTSVRGGWGMFMVPFILDGINQTGFSLNTPVIASPNLGLSFSSSLAQPFPTGLLSSGNLSSTALLGQGFGTVLQQNRKNGQVQRWEMSVQRELPGRWLLEASYIGNYGYDLLTNNDINATFRQFQSPSLIRDQNLINLLDANITNPFRSIEAFRGTSLFTDTNIRRSALLRPFPHYGGITQEFYDGSSAFHSGQLRLERRFSRGFTLLGTYVFSKYTERTTRLNPTDPGYENRLADADAPHRFVMSGIYELPFGRGRAFGADWSGWKQAVMGGFQVQGISQFQSGTPLTIGNIFFNGNLRELNLNVSTSTMGGIGTTNINDNTFGVDIRSLGFYFQDDAVRTNGQLDFEKQRNDARINLSNNLRILPSRSGALRNQPIILTDFSLIKNFTITERSYLQFRAEAINAFNRTHINGPVLNPRDTNFGRVTNTNLVTLPREYQLGLRLVF